MNQYVLGVDGGGTKTQCALYDTNGNEIDMVNWGTTSHEVLKGGFIELKRELSLLFNYILKRNNIDRNQIIKCVFGLAGVDTKEQHRTVSEIVTELGFENFILCNDAFLGVKAGCPEGYGLCVINGTGCCVAGIEPTGKMVQIGGQGYLTGDLGGGMYLGEFAVRSTYNYLFRCGDYTCMSDMLIEELGIKSKYEFIDEVRRKMDDGTLKITGLNKIVFKAANMGDKIALGLLEEVGKGLADSVNGILKELQFEKGKRISIVLAGSINVKGDNPTLLNALKSEILTKSRNKEIEFIMLEKPPVIGAVIWALEGILNKNSILEKFFAEEINSPVL